MYSARIINAVLGLWLVVSLAIWPHETAQTMNHFVMGGIVCAVAFLGAAIPWMRYLNVVFGAWVALSAFVLPTVRHDTFWNALLVGTGISIIGMLPNELPDYLRRNATPRDHFAG